MKYTSIDRVLISLEHKEPDRVPFDLGATGVTGININALNRLRQHLNLPKQADEFDSQVCQLGVIKDDLVDALKIDVRKINPNPPEAKGLARDSEKKGHYYSLTDELGIQWSMPVVGGHFYDLSRSPLEDMEYPEEIDDYPWPSFTQPERYTGIFENRKLITDVQKRAFVIDRNFSGMWETALWLCGYEKFLCDMLVNKDFSHRLMDKLTEMKMQYWERAIAACGDVPFIVSEADDLATQTGLMVSLDLYKEMVWPYHKKLFDFIRSKAKNKVYIFFHNDGACSETIPLLIDAGVDILNPIQVSCTGMDTARIKREYGKDISFWGALCDSQTILPFGTPDQVCEETKRRVTDSMKDGGFIAGPIHNVQSEVPVENFMAMWETLQEYGKY